MRRPAVVEVVGDGVHARPAAEPTGAASKSTAGATESAALAAASTTASPLALIKLLELSQCLRIELSLLAAALPLLIAGHLRAGLGAASTGGRRLC